MTASTSNDAASELLAGLRLPGVYGRTARRAARSPLARTDVAGFVGFESRVRVGLEPPALVAPNGHHFAVDVVASRVLIDDQPHAVPASRLTLSHANAAVPIADGQAIRYTIAVGALQGRGVLAFTRGTPAPIGLDQPPPENDPLAPVDVLRSVTAALAVAASARKIAPPAIPRWVRLADVSIRRETAGAGSSAIRTVILPYQRLERCDDWRDFVLTFGPPADDGAMLARVVESFFTNGGSRCYIAPVARPEFTDDASLERLSLPQMLGERGDSFEAATGLERLLMVDEVSIVDAPDLHAIRVAKQPPVVLKLPGAVEDACFRPCVERSSGTVTLRQAVEFGEPIFDTDHVLASQQAMWRRCAIDRWRAELLLTPTWTRDDRTGRWIAPDPPAASAWRDAMHTFCIGFDQRGTPSEGGSSMAAAYWPWLVVQPEVGGPQRLLPPTGAAAGIIARRDLARGVFVAPANERVLAVPALSWPVDDRVHEEMWDPEPDAAGRPKPSINLFRAFRGEGIQLWGARTLSTDRWPRYLPVRRALSAIQKRVRVQLEPLVFESNTPALWLQATHVVLNVLMPIYHAGGLRGTRPEESFYVRCDEEVNPPENIAAGFMVIEVGVAIAAPAEFVVFRVGRREGVVEVLE